MFFHCRQPQTPTEEIYKRLGYEKLEATLSYSTQQNFGDMEEPIGVLMKFDLTFIDKNPFDYSMLFLKYIDATYDFMCPVSIVKITGVETPYISILLPHVVAGSQLKINNFTLFGVKKGILK